MERRVVVVEDDEEIRELLRDVLRLNGIVPISVRRPDHVLDTASYEWPDAFLIDIMLPGKSGLEVAQELRANGFGDIPMIGLSASPIMRDVADDSGLFACTLLKPFDFDELMERMRELWEQTPPPTLRLVRGDRKD
jgi:DNA-binding response OmpR family regulator